MKAPIVVGIAIELLEEIVGFRLEAIQDAHVSPTGTAIYIQILANIEKEQINESIN